jgi:hypothetical protein
MKLSKMFPLLAAATLFADAPATASAAEVKKPAFAKKTYNEETGVVSFAFGNGETVEFDTNSCNEEVRTLLMLHGASQKIGDSYAGAKGNYAEGIASAKSVISQLLAGEWTATGEERGPRLAELAEAIAVIKNVAVEKAMAAVEKATDEQRKAWRSNAQVKAAIAKNRADKAAKALAAAAPAELVVDLG